jgi:hypothetical protein
MMNTMLYDTSKFELHAYNDELLETIWEHMEEIKKGRRGGDIIKLITSNSFTFLLHFHILKVKLKLKF